jgi:hypothetical protein
MACLEAHDIELGNRAILEVINTEMKKEVKIGVMQAFRGGAVKFEDSASNKEKLNDHAKLGAYVSGLINNWFRKDTRLNGGTSYVAKNPGSRSGVSDPQVKALKALLSQTTDPTDKVKVQRHLDARIATLDSLKVKTAIDYSALPDGLMDELGIE